MKKFIITLPKNETLNEQPIYARVMIPKEKEHLDFLKRFDIEFEKDEMKGESFLRRWVEIWGLKLLLSTIARKNKENVVGPICTFFSGLTKKNQAKVQVIFY